MILCRFCTRNNEPKSVNNSTGKITFLKLQHSSINRNSLAFWVIILGVFCTIPFGKFYRATDASAFLFHKLGSANPQWATKQKYRYNAFYSLTMWDNILNSWLYCCCYKDYKLDVHFSTWLTLEAILQSSRILEENKIDDQLI